MLLLAFALTAALAVRQKAATFDEVYHAPAAYVHLWQGDFRPDPEDPPLAKFWAALGQTFAPALNLRTDSPEWGSIVIDGGRTWYWSRLVLYQTPGTDADAFLWRSRRVMLLLGVGLGALLALWTWKLGGALAALVAVAFFALDPNFLAHTPLVKNDVPFTLVLLAFSWSLWRLGLRVTWGRFLTAGLLCGAMLCTKFSGILAGPLLLILMGARAFSPDPWPLLKTQLLTRASKLKLSAGLVLGLSLLAYLSLWGCYGLRYAAAPNGQRLERQFFLDYVGYYQTVATLHPASPPTQQELDQWRPGTMLRAIMKVDDWKLLPQSWTYGLLYTYGSSLVRNSFLLGKYSNTGWWYYFPVAMLVKTPTATLLALLATPLALWLARWPKARQPAPTRKARADTPPPDHRPDRLSVWTLLCLSVPPGLYAWSSLSANLNLGLRHILPLYPFLYLMIGLAAARAMQRWGRPVAWTLLGLGLLLAMEAGFAYPDFLPFFNTPSGGWRGGLHLLGDSNLDWGQDLTLLVEWRKKHPEGTLCYGYFGSADPHYYGLDYLPMPGTDAAGQEAVIPEQIKPPAYIAVHATVLQSIYNNRWRAYYARFRETYEPIEVLGGTIYIYTAE